MEKGNHKNNIQPLKAYIEEIKRNEWNIDTDAIKTYDILFKTWIANIMWWNRKNNRKMFNNDLLFLINSSKVIENDLWTEKHNRINNGNPTDKGIKKENLYYNEKVLLLEKEVNNLNLQKEQLKKSIAEWKYLLSEFDLKYASIPSWNPVDTDCLSSTNNQRNYEQINELISKQVIGWYKEKRFNECIIVWKKYNFQQLLGVSLERSYEILAFMMKIMEKTEKTGNTKVDKTWHNRAENDIVEDRKKNHEILELMSEIELYKCKLDENVIKWTDLKMKWNICIQDNNELYLQNQKWKNFLENK